MSITVASSEYNINAQAIEVYVSGCTHNCEGCHNPELQKFGVGKSWHKWLRLNKHKLKDKFVKRIWILGGDLMCQDVSAYLEMVNDLKKFDKELWLWTGKDFEEIPKEYEVIRYFDVIKTGRYLKDRPSKTFTYNSVGSTFDIVLASDNQKILSTGVLNVAQNL